MSKKTVLSIFFLLAGVQPAWSQSVTFNVFSRPVSDAEIAGGAPVGTVYDLSVTTNDDILSLGFDELRASPFQHPLGSNNGFNSGLAAYYTDEDPTFGLDSWFTTPGNTLVLGDGFDVSPGKQTLWGDLSNDGAVSDFQFGRLTIPAHTTASFQGSLGIRGEYGPDKYPFSFSIDGLGGFNWANHDPVLFYNPPLPKVEPIPQPIPQPEPQPFPQLEPPVISDPENGQTVFSQSVGFNVASRRVSELEIAAGAPTGTVYDLFVTTNDDILSLGFTEFRASPFQHPLGGDNGVNADLVAFYSEEDPTFGLDSWFTTPGNTMMLGGGFDVSPGDEPLWGDLSNDGAVSDFQFGRLTIPDGSTASFQGSLGIRGEYGPDTYPFSFSIDEMGGFDWVNHDPDLFSTSQLPKVELEPPVDEEPVVEEPVVEETVVEESVVEESVEVVDVDRLLLDPRSIFRIADFDWDAEGITVVVSLDQFVMDIDGEGSTGLASTMLLLDKSISFSSWSSRFLINGNTALTTLATADDSISSNSLPEPGTCLLTLLGMMGSMMIRPRGVTYRRTQV